MAMVQYGVWPNCCNNCKFCLRLNRDVYKSDKLIKLIQGIRKNLDVIDWKDKFSHGISLLGGELYFITDKDVQEEFLLLIDDIIEKILKVSPNPLVKYSTVTNGLYNPEFLFKVIDRIVEQCGIQVLDINFSFDLKYRFKSEKDKNLVLENIQKFHDRYNYIVGVQMIMTQYLINSMVYEKTFDISDFTKTYIPGGFLKFLYPHTIHSGYVLDDFNFTRKSFIDLLFYLNTNYPEHFYSFVYSMKNSSIFKYTGWHDKFGDPTTYKPELTDGKEIMNPKCGHSVLYQCYSDSDKCAFCDAKALFTI